MHSDDVIMLIALLVPQICFYALLIVLARQR